MLCSNFQEPKGAPCSVPRATIAGRRAWRRRARGADCREQQAQAPAPAAAVPAPVRAAASSRRDNHRPRRRRCSKRQRLLPPRRPVCRPE